MTKPAFHSIRLSGGPDGTVITVVDPPQVEIRISARVARRLLREVVAEAGRGHRIKDGCSYALGGCPHCLVGRALAKAGVTVAELEAMDGSGSTAISDAVLPGRLRVSGPAMRVLGTAQWEQDWSRPWGVALDAALWVRPYHREQLVGVA